MSKRRSSPKPPPAAEPSHTRWDLVEKVLHMKEVRTAYFYGPPGVGKTLAAYCEGRLDNGLYAITLTEDTPAAELRGHYLPQGNTMVWHDGPFTTAMRRGARLVINELSHGTPEAMSLLYPVLESFETAQLTLPTNETVRPAPGFHVVATDNVPPDDLPPALQDRFDCILELTEPHPEAIARLKEPLRRAALRSFSLQKDRRTSIRGWLTVQKLQDHLGLRDACLVVFGPDRGPQLHDAIVLAASENGNGRGAR